MLHDYHIHLVFAEIAKMKMYRKTIKFNKLKKTVMKMNRKKELLNLAS